MIQLTKCIIGSILLIALSIPSIAQNKDKNLYPVTKNIKTSRYHKGEMTSPFAYSALRYGKLDKKKGDGEGKMLVFKYLADGNEQNSTSLLGFKEFTWFVTRYDYYEGKVTDEGKTFTGEKYTVFVKYEHQNGTEFYVPVNPVDFNNIKGATGVLHFSGVLKSTSGWVDYYGPLEGKYSAVSYPSKEVESYTSIVHDAVEGLATLRYKPNEKKIITAKGRIDHQFLNMKFGSVTYEDGSTYKGYFQNSARTGIGILTSKSNKVLQQGLWANDELFMTREIQLPKSYFESGNKSDDFVKSNLVFNDISKEGYLYRGSKDSTVYFLSEYDDLLFYGSLLNKTPTGVCYLKKAMLFAPAAVYRKIEQVPTEELGVIMAKFPLSKNEQQVRLFIGVVTSRGQHWQLQENVQLLKGKLINDKLNGCGTQIKSEISPWSLITVEQNGKFLDGNVTGFYSEKNAGGALTLKHSEAAKWNATEFYNKLLSQKGIDCEIANKEELAVVTTNAKLASEAWLASADKRAKLQAIQKGYDDAAKAKKMQEGEDVLLARSMAGHILQWKSPYGSSPGGTYYFITVKDRYLIFLSASEEPAAYIEKPVSEINNYVDTKITHNAKVCDQCNGFGLVYREKTQLGLGTQIWKRELVTRYNGSKSVTKYTTFSPQYYLAKYCPLCKGKKIIDSGQKR